MAQHDYDIANQSGSAFRADLNNALEAIQTNNSGGTQPATIVAYMWWTDTATNQIKLRNAGNTAWQELLTFDGNVTGRDFGVGTNDPGDYNADARNLVVYESSANAGITVATSSSSFKTSVYFADGTTSGANSVGRIEYDHSDNSLSLFTNGNARQYIGQGGTTYAMATANVLTAQSAASAGTTFTLFLGRHSSTGGSINTGTESFKVYTNGNVQNTNNSYGAISDINRKENITDANSQWSDLKSIQVKNFNYIGDSVSQIGVVAQQVETVSPGLVYESTETDENDAPTGVTTKAVKYSVLYMKAVKALQEAMERIETLETSVAALEARVTTLEAP